MAYNENEEVPYRNSAADLKALVDDTTFSKDEEDQGTLRNVYKILKDGVDDLDKWHAFDLTESELRLKQQIKAHQVAASILQPSLEAVEQALAMVDEKFRRRNNT